MSRYHVTRDEEIALVMERRGAFADRDRRIAILEAELVATWAVAGGSSHRHCRRHEW